MPEPAAPAKEMTPQEALRLLTQAIPSVPTNLQTHMLLQKALTTLAGAIKK